MTTEEKIIQGNTNINPCSPNSCNEGGICVPGKFDSFECICFRGYSGKFCEVKNVISNSNQQKLESLITITPTTTEVAFNFPPEFNSLKNSASQVSNLVEQAYMRTSTHQMPFFTEINPSQKQPYSNEKKNILVNFEHPDLVNIKPPAFTSSDIKEFNKAIQSVFSKPIIIKTPQVIDNLITTEGQTIPNLNSESENVVHIVNKIKNFDTNKIVESIQSKISESKGIDIDPLKKNQINFIEQKSESIKSITSTRPNTI